MKLFPFFLSLTMILLGAFSTVKAHDPSQISYLFSKEGTLRVHFTPKGAMDLLLNLRPELEDQAVIELDAYRSDFETYLNETVSLRVSGKAISLKLLHGDMTSHDAWLECKLEHFPGTYDGAVIQVKAFIEVYTRVTNYVRVEGEQENYSFVLTRKKQGLQIGETVQAAYEPSTRFWYPYYIALSILFAIGIWYRARKKIYG